MLSFQLTQTDKGTNQIDVISRYPGQQTRIIIQEDSWAGADMNYVVKCLNAAKLPEVATNEEIREVYQASLLLGKAYQESNDRT